MSKRIEIFEEFQALVKGRGGRFLDALLPTLVFIGFHAWFGFRPALIGAIAASLFLAIARIIKKTSLVYALGGFGSVLFAAGLAMLSGTGTGFFVPGLISGGVTVVACIVSVVVNRPLVAWTSALARRWPRGWYWHPKVLPAYNEVTIFWGVSFAVRFIVEFRLLELNATEALGTARLIFGWPYTLILLVGSYIYGQRRLRHLKGPSVEEFTTDQPPPWEGQRRGF